MYRKHSSAIGRAQLALVDIYAAEAGIPDVKRRDIMERAAGVRSSKHLDNAGFHRVMAALEAALWEHVDGGLAPDPRRCTVCGRLLQRRGKMGHCQEGCETRRVHIWSRDHWRKRCPVPGMANTREIHKLRELWTLLLDYLPHHKRNDVYLVAIARKACPCATETPGETVARMTDANGHMRWQSLRQTECLSMIEAVKDRLSYATR